MEDNSPKNQTASMVLMPALCVDLDGTVRRSKIDPKGFIQSNEDMELMPGMEKIMMRYRQMGYIIIGCSNQAGIAHGHKTIEYLDEETKHMISLFKENPFHIIKYAFQDAKGHVEPWCHRSLFRKPNIGMLAAAEVEAWEHGVVIDWDRSLFVGDRPEDEGCAKNAEIKFHHIDEFLNMPHEFEIKTESDPNSPTDPQMESASDPETDHNQ